MSSSWPAGLLRANNGASTIQAPGADQSAHELLRRLQRGIPNVSGQVMIVMSWIDESLVDLVDELLDCESPTRSWNIILTTRGGSVGSARRLCAVLRARCDDLEIHVPRRARSCGTLVALSGKSVAMSLAAELGPLDSFMPSLDGQSSPAPEVAVEDLRQLETAMREWFGLNGEVDRRELVRAVLNGFFPATLGSLFRQYRMTRDIVREQVDLHCADCSDAKRDAVVTYLVSGFPTHDYPVLLKDAVSLGLNVRAMTPAELVYHRQLHPLCEAVQLSDRRSEDSEPLGIVATQERVCVRKRGNAHGAMQWNLLAAGRKA
jgi:serine dehydrogenase proteinase